MRSAFRSLGGQPAILEGSSLSSAKSRWSRRAGSTAISSPGTSAATPTSNIFSPPPWFPPISAPDLTARAFDKARKIAEALDYVGVLAVEMFLVEGPEGQSLLVNEIAPRVHNSGHWTMDGAATSQFEQHVRAICGFPLGSARAHGPVEMRNLIGDDILRWRELLVQPGACLHLYGKADARPGRKMGHVTFLRSL